MQTEINRNLGTILVLDKIDFKVKSLIRYKEGHYMMIKGSVQEGDITFINYADSSRPYVL